MNDGAEDPVSLGASLDAVMRSLKGANGRAHGGVFAAWESIVGATVASHAKPVALDNGRLLVEVDQPGWATQLRYLESDLIERLKPHTAGVELTSIELRVARGESDRYPGRQR